jgi:hypothetical protein
MKMTTSGKIARVFEIAGYIWLLPSVISLGLLVIYSIALTLAGHPVGIFVLAIIAGIFSAGVFLLRRYYAHSRGFLDEKKILPLWYATLAFNLMFLLPSIYFQYSTGALDYSYDNGEIVTILIGYSPLFWWATAVMLSVAAIISELKNQKYR